MPAFTHHIFVCCRARDAGHPRGCCDPDRCEGLLKRFEVELDEQGLSGQVRANRAECLDQCEHGPAVVIYPQTIWYGRVREEDIPRIVRETIVKGAILHDLVIADECLNNSDCPHVRSRQSAAELRGSS
jgi:(2Fe-2S) ferredoxin